VPTTVPILNPSPSLARRAALGLVAAVLIATGAAAGGAGAPAIGLDPVGPQRAAIRQLETEVLGLDRRAGVARAAYARARARLATLAAEVRANAAALRSAIGQRGVAQRRLATRLVAIYREPAPPELAELLLTTRSLSGALTGYRQLERIQQADEQVVVDLIAARRRIARVRQMLLADRAEAEVTLARATVIQERAEGILGARRAALAQAHGYLNELEARERRRAAAAYAPSGAPSTSPSGAVGSGGGVSSRLASIAWCESRNRPDAVSPDGRYRGKYQFDPATWAAIGGSGDPAAAPVAEQDRLAAVLYAQTGGAAWPVCRYGG
jgi:transglycosylase-like protein